MRYLNGQAVWDRRFARSIRSIAKRREKNLRDARTRDSKKIVQIWQDKIHSDSGERTRDRLHRIMTAQSTGSESDRGWETEVERNSHQHGLLDQSWSWEWALDGEAPPPSAIVSRRDFGEARQLALMADRMDDDHEHTGVHGLSIWVGLAAFFSSSHERNEAEEMVKHAQETRDDEKHSRRKKGLVGRVRGVFGKGKGKGEKKEDDDSG